MAYGIYLDFDDDTRGLVGVFTSRALAENALASIHRADYCHIVEFELDTLYTEPDMVHQGEPLEC